MPVGSFDADPSDLVTVAADGTVWWHPRLLSDAPRDPVQVGTVRVDIAAHHPTFGGFVNGSLLLHGGDLLEPTMAYTAPGADPVPAFAGHGLNVSPNGTRVLADMTGGVEPGLAIYDWQDGVVLRLGVSIEQLAWAPNSREVVFVEGDDDGTHLQRRRADPSWELLDDVVLLEPDAIVAHLQEHGEPILIWLLGVWGSEVALAFESADGTEFGVLPYDDFSGRVTSAPWWPTGTTAVSPEQSARIAHGPADSDLIVAFRDDRPSIELADTADAFFVPPPVITR